MNCTSGAERPTFSRRYLEHHRSSATREPLRRLSSLSLNRCSAVNDLLLILTDLNFGNAAVSGHRAGLTNVLNGGGRPARAAGGVSVSHRER
jgi:hypothetical protein